MKRREFIALLGGAAAAWPLPGRAQDEPMKVVGVLLENAESDEQGQIRLAAFMRRLVELGWTGPRAKIEIRWAAADAAQFRSDATELVALAPDVILAASSPAVAALLQITRVVPVVFTNIADPVSAGFGASLARPGGNATGFLVFEYSLSAKWLEMLKHIAPRLRRVAVLHDATQAAGIGQLAAIQTVAQSSGTKVIPIGLGDATEIERGISAFAGAADGGLIVTGSPSTGYHRELIIALAAKNRLPAVYPYRHFAAHGGLISYGPDQIEPFRRAADYVDRILRGEKPADLPVQAPTRYELVINRKTAKALGISIPPPLLATADEVIE